MSEILVLRFRDLVTEPGGTIAEHLSILEDRKSVWWGWWMRQNETAPRELFRDLLVRLGKGADDRAFLFDSGREQLHGCVISDLRVAQEGETIGPPQLDITPEYYQRGTYPAWFRLTAIASRGIGEVPEGWRYAGLPTRPGTKLEERVGEPVGSLEELRTSDATMWLVEDAT